MAKIVNKLLSSFLSLWLYRECITIGEKVQGDIGFNLVILAIVVPGVVTWKLMRFIYDKKD